MRHPDDGVLRRLVDEPAGVADADRAHLAGCDECLRHLTAVSEDADLVHAASAIDVGADVDLTAAWQRLSTARSATAPRRVGVATAAATPRRRAGRVREVLKRPVVASVAAGAVLVGAGTAAANDWLQIFQAEQIAPMSLSVADLNALPDLRDYGDVDVTAEPDVHPVADAAEAEAGLDVPEVTSLPPGVSGEPIYQVGGEASVTFTFSADRAAQAAAEVGETLPPPPPGLDGSRVRLVAGPGVAGVWSSSSGAPALLVGRAEAPRALSSSGLPFETMRDYLLALPGLPEDVAAALLTFNPDDSTLPLPVPADDFTTSSAEVEGVRATVLATRDRSMAAVVWVKEGLVTVVAGTLDVDEVLSVAGELR